MGQWGHWSEPHRRHNVYSRFSSVYRHLRMGRCSDQAVVKNIQKINYITINSQLEQISCLTCEKWRNMKFISVWKYIKSLKLHGIIFNVLSIGTKVISWRVINWSEYLIQTWERDWGIKLTEINYSSSRIRICRGTYTKGGMRWRSGWGNKLQASWSRFRTPMVSLEFFIDIIRPAALI